MARADFYLIAKPRFLEKPLLLVCELARKANDSGQPMLIFAASAAQAEVLDELLWEFDPRRIHPAPDRRHGRRRRHHARC